MNETRNITITLDKAREWYNSSDSNLKEIALQAFSEEELIFSFKSIKTFEDACKVLDINKKDFEYETKSYIFEKTKASIAAIKLNIIRQALNKDYKMSLTIGGVYYPQLRFTTQKSTFYNIELKSGSMKKVATFRVNNKEYNLLGGGIINNSVYEGLSSFEPSYNIGYSHASSGFLGCATREIAEHMSRYFAKEIFEAMYSDFIDFEWIN